AARDVTAHVVVRARTLDALLTRADPVVEAVTPSERHHIVAGLVEAADVHLLAGIERDLAAAGRDGRASADHADARVAALFVVDPALAGALGGPARVRRVHSEPLGVAGGPDLEGGRSRREGELLGVPGQVERSQIGARIEACGVAAAELQLEAPALAGVH